MINSEVLESFLIPAEEGLFFDHKQMIDIDNLNQRKCLFVFATDSSIKFGGAPVNSLMKKYNYKKAICINFDTYLDYVSGNIEKINLPNEFDVLIKLNENRNGNTKYITILQEVLDIGDELAKKGTLVVIVSNHSDVFSYSNVRGYPVIVMNNSMIKHFTSSMVSDAKYNYHYIKEMNKEFNRFNNKIPKDLFVKDTNLELFHVSPNGKIKELTPRITNKPMDDENIRIPRISAAPDIDSCFRAVGFQEKVKNKPVKYYVYKLALTNQHRVVKPTTDLVPDQEDTNEYWVLDPVKVECLGYITISFDKNKNHYIFDDSKVK